MSKEVAVKEKRIDLGKLEQVLLKGDLAMLTEAESIEYYQRVCESVGLNPLTKPFEYMNLNGKRILYSNKGCAEQLRNIHQISIRVTSRETIEGVYVVTAAAQDASGRIDESTGAVQISGLKGDSLANAMMKAETKAKRRVTLSICGLNMLDDTEVETIKSDRQAYRPWMEQPKVGDGHVPPPGTYRIPKGSWKGRGVHEIPIADMRKLDEKYDMEPSLEDWEMQLHVLIKEYLATQASIEPISESDEQPEKIVCKCGSDLKFSNNKGVYYCPNFKDTTAEHIRPVPKEVYEAVPA